MASHVFRWCPECDCLRCHLVADSLVECCWCFEPSELKEPDQSGGWKVPQEADMLASLRRWSALLGVSGDVNIKADIDWAIAEIEKLRAEVERLKNLPSVAGMVKEFYGELGEEPDRSSGGLIDD